jgi:hypothetical protein
LDMIELCEVVQRGGRSTPRPLFSFMIDEHTRNPSRLFFPL